MSGEMLFEARADVALPATTDLTRLQAALEQTANDLTVDLKVLKLDREKR
jgi:glycine cleavage system regulatory protein